jgi:hypothetical protein
MPETKKRSNEPVTADIEEGPVADGRWIMRKQRIVKDDGRFLIFYEFEEAEREPQSPSLESRNLQ